MLRLNLLHFALLILLTVGASVPAGAQHMPMSGYMPHGAGHTPLIRMPQSGYQAPIIDHYVQQTPGLWDDQQPIEQFLTAVASRSWIRLEYLNWEFNEPGNALVGAPVTDVRTPDQQFQVFDNFNGGADVGLAQIPVLNNLQLNDTPGIRGTLGVDLNGGALELSFFGTEQNTDALQINGISNFRNDPNAAIPTNIALGTAERPNYVTPLLSGGVAQPTTSLNAIVYDNSFSAEITGQIWGAEAIFLTDSVMPGEGLHWQWLGGFRYISFDEEFQVAGTFDNGGTQALRTTQYGALTANNIYGPEVGARVSAVHQWLTLSATPRIAFALNDYTASVRTGTLTSPLDTPTRITQEEIDFTPVVQVNLQAEVHVNSHLSFFGGYDLLWMNRVTRPYDNIVYDSALDANGVLSPQLGQSVDLNIWHARGFSFGAVFRY